MRATPACGRRVALAQRLAPLARGEVGGVGGRRAAGAAARPRLPGRRRRTSAALADWRGRTVLLNLWATWCVPCRKEMPALDALEGQARRRRLRGGRDQHRHPRSREAEDLAQGGRHRRASTYYADPSAKVFQDLKVVGRAVRHADDAAGRSGGLRDRHAGGAGGMGERGRREARDRGIGEVIAAIAADDNGSSSIRTPET